ncbi:MAG: SMI1/KNR4 family protein [Pirellulaceae bacterium]|nr:SMI1/KNR4 family protein [Planctomycetales bacterium]
MANASPVESLPETRADRWLALQTLISHWYRPLSEGDGVHAVDLDHAEQTLGISLPMAFREWYVQSGNRSDVWCGQDRLLPPNELSLQDDALIFYVENQGVVRWGIPVESLSSEDPPVVVESVDNAAEWHVENDSLSAFAVQRAVFDIKFSPNCRCWANGAGNAAVLNIIAESVPRLGFPSWHWPWPGRTEFFGYRDLIVETNGGVDWIWVSSRTELDFQELERLLLPAGIRWEASSEEWPPGWFSSSSTP